MSKIKVAIIDSGFDLKHPKFQYINDKIISFNVLNQSNFAEDQDLGNKNGHGTGILSIIYDHIYEEKEKFEFYNVKIFDEKGHTSEEYLINALEYCLLNKVNIINLSLGIETNSPSDDLYKICEDAYKQGILLVAATSDNDVKTYPAYFPFVYGVTGGIISEKSQYGITSNNYIKFIGKGNMQKVADLNGKDAFVSGNSFAAAHICGIICNMLIQVEPDFHKIEETLIKNGKTDIRIFTNKFMQYTSPASSFNYRFKPSKDNCEAILKKLFCYEEKFSWIRKIAIYPLSNKEMKAFHHFGDLCPFEVSEIYDFPEYALQGKNITISNKIKPVKWDIDENTLQSFDTLVIGHPYDTSLEINAALSNKIIERCINQKKNFYVFDKLLYLELKNKLKGSKSKVYYPNNSGGLLELTSMLEFNKIKTPNLTVISAIPNSGKFTTQLAVKQILETAGYNTSWISTEPESELFGADFCLPIGGELNSLTIGPWPYFLPAIVSGIEKYKKPDILISGHQSGLLHKNHGYFQQNALNAINFLTAIRSDGVICAISKETTSEQLERLVGIMQSLFQLPILFFTLSKRIRKPKEGIRSESGIKQNCIIDDREWEEIAESISKKYNLPVLDPLKESHKSIILEQITNFFN